MSRLATILGLVIAASVALIGPPAALAQASATQITIAQPAEATTMDPGRSTQVLTVNYFYNLLHGEGDAQIPLAVAQKCFDAVGSRRKTFKVFTRDEGGDHHCQSDNVSLGTAYMWDWLEEVLEPRRRV